MEVEGLHAELKHVKRTVRELNVRISSDWLLNYVLNLASKGLSNLFIAAILTPNFHRV